MKLYKMELCKILKKKFTWLASGGLLFVLLVLFCTEISRAENMIVEFGAVTGYRRFLDLLQFFSVDMSIWLVCVLASFYCEDKQHKVDILLSTTTRGKWNDFLARLWTTLTITMGALFSIAFFAFFICYVLYGYPEGNFLVKDIYISTIGAAPSLAERTISFFIKSYFIILFSGFVMLDTFVILISTMSKKSMYSLIIILGVFLFPIVIEGTFKNGNIRIAYTVTTGQPILLMTLRCFEESWRVYGWHIFIAYITAVIGILCAGKKWSSISKK